ncbi:SAPS-domain-containing protein [Annulohypoxylon maeteangense]|uniref:SAPS-domain-containing protein n=1 Tax=Annulohypoxylon maeteangense TaxID=1927788 RepID=UPI0020082FDF|nr:SAPS-domain-containing protein [Annulohypoxylon maeteangense]KAI0880200.1 SAPS-domain-containing protein [Annulohypoxylon maeteangense]
MFWRFGGYANISTIDTILDKPDFQLEDLLDESDLIQELKQHNTKLIEYLREPKVLERLLEYVVTPKLEPVETPENDTNEDDKKGRSRGLSFGRPRASSRATSDGADEDEVEKKRNRYAYVAAEVLSSDNWSIYEALMESHHLLCNFWDFLKLPSPLDPLQASYFTKVNEALFDKKTDEMIALLKSLDDAISNVLRHVDCPMIMDLLLKIISLERTENGQGIVEWLYTKDVMPTLLSFLGPGHSYATQTSAGDFIKAIITVSANASQNEQACIGPNELTRQLVSKPCIQTLIGYMLGGGNALTVGVGIVIEVIRKNNSDYDPDVGPDSNALPSSRDPIYLGTLLRFFANHVPDFMSLILNAPAQKHQLESTFGEKIEPLGFDRFKTCELMAELLHCSNMSLLNEIGSEQVIALRDEERQRLRAQGRLTANRGEDVQSSEDLTMRMRHSSPDDGRRLEVTNASDDDGFEEVAPAGEMTEDTSHEFVKAEDEIANGPASSFLDKEDDDFVEEPLSSPRLIVYDGRVDEQQFENPELVVAPLSPKKPAALQHLTREDDSPIGSSESQPSQPATEPRRTEEASHHSEGAGHSVPAGVEETEPLPTCEESYSKPSDIPETSASSTAHLGEEVSPFPAEVFAAIDTSVANELSAVSDELSQMKFESVDIPSGDIPITAVGQPESGPSGAGERLDPVVGDFLKMQFVEYQVVPTILSFFFMYPWNNFLHNVVYDIVQQVFNGPMDRGYNPTLAISLFEAADITNAIINGQATSEQSQARNKTRMGYMGHLTLIAEEVVKFTERNPPELLSELVLDRVMSQDWINYVEGALAETRERDNAILGGIRPEVALNNRAQMAGNGLGGMGLSSLGLGGAQGGGSSALAEAGLNGGGGGMEIQDNGSGSSLGPFSISSGLLSGSGFGSSSDEEEDDAEDNEEDVNNEFRAYTDPLNTSSSSMDPPSVPPPPPPPPPLNIPPSRARLQLAARLKMHQKNAATASAQPGEAENDVESDEHGSGRDTEDILRNPFEDDGEDDVDDESDDGLGEADGNRDAWGAGPSRGSWWRGALRRGRERFGDGRDDSDSEKDEAAEGDEEDEEFGEFAMPEVDKDGSNEKGGVIVKPLPVHPPSQNQKTSAFTSLWPFGSKEKDKQKIKEGETSEKVEEDSEITGDDGEKIKSTHEAARRTSIEDPDDEEVVV